MLGVWTDGCRARSASTVIVAGASLSPRGPARQIGESDRACHPPRSRHHPARHRRGGWNSDDVCNANHHRSGWVGDLASGWRRRSTARCGTGCTSEDFLHRRIVELRCRGSRRTRHARLRARRQRDHARAGTPGSSVGSLCCSPRRVCRVRRPRRSSASAICGSIRVDCRFLGHQRGCRTPRLSLPPLSHGDAERCRADEPNDPRWSPTVAGHLHRRRRRFTDDDCLAPGGSRHAPLLTRVPSRLAQPGSPRTAELGASASRQRSDGGVGERRPRWGARAARPSGRTAAWPTISTISSRR